MCIPLSNTPAGNIMTGNLMLKQLLREVSQHKAYRMPPGYSSKALIYIADRHFWLGAGGE